MQPVTIPALLRQAAVAAAGRDAFALDGGPTLTYEDWERRSEAVASGLLRGGVRPGARVALLFDTARWAEYAVTYLGVLKAAAVAVPLGDGLSDLELNRILLHCQASMIVAPPDLAPQRSSVPVTHFGELEDAGWADSLPPSDDPSALAEILYVSRPLTLPVPIPSSHRALLAGPCRDFATGVRLTSLLHACPVGTMAGQDALGACLYFAPLRVVVLPSFDPERFCALLSNEQIPAALLHPSAVHALLVSGATARHDLSCVTRLVLMSGRVPPELLLRLTAAFPRAGLLTVDVLDHQPPPRTLFAHDRGRPGSIGRPLGRTQVWIRDEAGRQAGVGQVGHVFVAGAPAGSEQQQTTESGTDDVATGELGYLDDRGFLYLTTGRSDLVSGRESALLGGEVECTLREHPAVADAAVVGIPDDGSGRQLAAAVVLNSPATSSELQALVRDRLGRSKTPDTVFFLDELPRNPLGLVLRSDLRRRLGLTLDAAAARVGAPMAVEETIAAIWRRVLGGRDTGRADDFFELGGDWRAATKVLTLLEDAFEVSIPLAAFLDSPTIAGLASAVERLRPPHDRDPPVAFSQEGMLWYERFAPGCQNLPGLARRYSGPLDVEALGRALNEILRRHSALRTNFELRDGRLVQAVRPHDYEELPVRDLSGIPSGERDREVERLVVEAGRRPFDLTSDPLFEPTLLRLDHDDHVLVIRTHHSVFDDWSVGVFRRELAALYAAYRDGDASPLPELPLQFADFSRTQRRALAGPRGTRELAFWRRELEGAPFTTQLPLDDPDLPEGSPQATSEPISLDVQPELAERLRALARRERTTVFMTVLAAFGVLVQRYIGQSDLVLASVVANRNRTEFEGLIGCFTKKVPLRLPLEGDPTFTEVLARTRAALLSALAHQDLPFEAVVQDVLGAPAATHGLVPQVVLMFQGVTPREEFVLPGLETTGFETSTTTRRDHFMAGPDERSDADVRAEPGHAQGEEHIPPAVWGDGLYLGSFLILSLVESGEGLSCIARGVFHAPSARQLLGSFHTLLA
ncbi:MAG: condensation domain-containing protein, partial [Actinomycetota bacterium]|nr:condensation domain-containing protein [Actinomycetota bacterium]